MSDPAVCRRRPGGAAGRAARRAVSARQRRRLVRAGGGAADHAAAGRAAPRRRAGLAEGGRHSTAAHRAEAGPARRQLAQQRGPPGGAAAGPGVILRTGENGPLQYGLISCCSDGYRRERTDCAVILRTGLSHSSVALVSCRVLFYFVSRGNLIKFLVGIYCFDYLRQYCYICS